MSTVNPSYTSRREPFSRSFYRWGKQTWSILGKVKCFQIFSCWDFWNPGIVFHSMHFIWTFWEPLVYRILSFLKTLFQNTFHNIYIVKLCRVVIWRHFQDTSKQSYISLLFSTNILKYPWIRSLHPTQWMPRNWMPSAACLDSEDLGLPLCVSWFSLEEIWRQRVLCRGTHCHWTRRMGQSEAELNTGSRKRRTHRSNSEKRPCRSAVDLGSRSESSGSWGQDFRGRGASFILTACVGGAPLGWWLCPEMRRCDQEVYFLSWCFCFVCQMKTPPFNYSPFTQSLGGKAKPLFL